jgi:hypothetical protein
MVPTTIDPNDGLLLHFLTIHRHDLPSKCTHSRGDQNLSAADYRWRAGDEPDV